ncbi:MAG TPA: c-type cytochrome [Terriglobales bacterium]|nr:c-type cytochrome [Terriglobales bacterium]
MRVQAASGISLLIATALLVGCEREVRNFRATAAVSHPADTNVQQSSNQPGVPQPPPTADGKSVVPAMYGTYSENAYAVGEGKRLYLAFNCYGCHANGGGGIGPPLLDGYWKYGGHPPDIYRSIVEGRPNGMPSFRGKIPEYQVWWLVAYVRSMSGNVPKDAAPSRSDHMSANKPELRKEKEGPNR